MALEWDSDKNAANIAKHGIDFEDAIRIFEGPVLESTDERRRYGEVRRERKAYREAYLKEPPPRKTDWAGVDSTSDREIENAIKADPDAAPILDKEWFRRAKLVLPERKVPISLRIDREVVEWFKAHGTRYQSRMNAVLKAYVQAHRKVSSL